MERELAVQVGGAVPLLPAPRHRRHIRQRASLRLVDVAELLRVDASTVSRWERGHVEPRGSAVVLYAALLAHLRTFQVTLNADTPPGGTDGASKTNDAGVRSRLRY